MTSAAGWLLCRACQAEEEDPQHQVTLDLCRPTGTFLSLTAPPSRDIVKILLPKVCMKKLPSSDTLKNTL